MAQPDRFFLAEMAVLLGLAGVGAAVGPVGAAAAGASAPVTSEPSAFAPMPPDTPVYATPDPPVIPVRFAEPPPPPEPPRWRTGLASCDAYLERLEELTTCEGLPADTRQQLRQSVDQVEAAWREANWDQLPLSARQAAADACAQATSAIEQSMQQLCP
jgi:hypothetical protein